MPGVTSSSASPNSRYMSSRQISPSSRQWLWMVAKFSARSWLNRIRCALNSASASISLTTPAMRVLLCGWLAGPPADAVEFGGQLVQACLDDVRVLGDPARRDVLHSAVVRNLGPLFLHNGVYGRGQRRQEAINLPVLVGEFLGHLAQYGPRRVYGWLDRCGRHVIPDRAQLFAMRFPDRPAEPDPQLRGGAFSPASARRPASARTSSHSPRSISVPARASELPT